jgi:hypothetical protein
MNAQRAEKYLNYLKEKINVNAEVLGVEADNDDCILVAVCPNYPEEGLTTGFTYGLSEVQKDEWNEWKPELSITVTSEQMEWLLAAAHIVENHRHTSTFMPGSLFDIGNTIHPESEMQAFLVFNSSTDPDKIFDNIELMSPNDMVKVLALYPLYVGEVEMLHKVGMRKFFGLPEYKLFTLNRPDLSSVYSIGEQK